MNSLQIEFTSFQIRLINIMFFQNIQVLVVILLLSLKKIKVIFLLFETQRFGYEQKSQGLHDCRDCLRTRWHARRFNGCHSIISPNFSTSSQYTILVEFRSNAAPTPMQSSLENVDQVDLSNFISARNVY